MVWCPYEIYGIAPVTFLLKLPSVSLLISAYKRNSVWGSWRQSTFAFDIQKKIYTEAISNLDVVRVRYLRHCWRTYFRSNASAANFEMPDMGFYVKWRQIIIGVIGSTVSVFLRVCERARHQPVFLRWIYRPILSHVDRVIEAAVCVSTAM
jgi:hypothetical protein